MKVLICPLCGRSVDPVADGMIDSGFSYCGSSTRGKNDPPSCSTVYGQLLQFQTSPIHSNRLIEEPKVKLLISELERIKASMALSSNVEDYTEIGRIENTLKDFRND